MKLTLSNPDWSKNTPKLIEWSVFLGFCAAAAWCFWFYYDTTQKIEKKEEVITAGDIAVKESLWKKVIATEDKRAENFLTPPVITRDPF